MDHADSKDIPLINRTPHSKANQDEITLVPIQPFNVI